MSFDQFWQKNIDREPKAGQYARDLSLSTWIYDGNPDSRLPETGS